MLCKNKNLFGFDTFDQFPIAKNRKDQKQDLNLSKKQVQNLLQFPL